VSKGTHAVVPHRAETPNPDPGGPNRRLNLPRPLSISAVDPNTLPYVRSPRLCACVQPAKGLRNRPAPTRNAIFKLVRYFLRARYPGISSILLVESGARSIVERVLPALRRGYGEEVRIDLVSCFAARPQGYDERTRVFRVADYRGREGRGKLYRELIANRYSVMGIVCSGEPLMTKWKLALALKIPAKVFIVNENADYFWLDLGHSKQVRRFVLFRAGLAGAGAVRTVARVVSFPFALLYLLLYATAVHARRALRKA
jgi:hypothetical protein